MMGDEEPPTDPKMAIYALWIDVRNMKADRARDALALRDKGQHEEKQQDRRDNWLRIAATVVFGSMMTVILKQFGWL